MAERAVTLREERFERGSYHLRARIREDHALVIEGQDIGPTVGEFWGGSEYEWEIAVAAGDVPRFVEALGGRPGSDDPLDLLAARYGEDQRFARRTFLEEQKIPFRFWSRVGG